MLRNDRSCHKQVAKRPVGLLLGTFKYWVLLIAAILQKSTQYLDDVINFTLGSF